MIMNHQQIISVFFLALFFYVIYTLLQIFSPFMGALFWAAVLAYAFYPIHKRLRKKFGARQNIAAGVMTFVILLFIAPFITIIVFRLTVEIVGLSQSLADHIQSGRMELQVREWMQSPLYRQIESNAGTGQQIWEKMQSSLVDVTKNAGSIALGFAAAFTRNLISILFNFILAMVAIFFFLRDGDKLYTYVYDLIPLEKENKEKISKQIQTTLNSTIHGQLLIAVSKGVLTGVTFWLLGLPFPIFIGTLSMLASVIPVLGTYVIWFPFVVSLCIQQEYVKAGILFGIGALIIASIDNVLYPIIVGKGTKAPFLFLLLAVLGGLAVYGMEGIIMGPIVVSLFFVLVNIYRYSYIESANKKTS